MAAAGWGSAEEEDSGSVEKAGWGWAAVGWVAPAEAVSAAAGLGWAVAVGWGSAEEEDSGSVEKAGSGWAAVGSG